MKWPSYPNHILVTKARKNFLSMHVGLKHARILVLPLSSTIDSAPKLNMGENKPKIFPSIFLLKSFLELSLYETKFYMD